jgi:putative chitinase
MMNKLTGIVPGKILLESANIKELNSPLRIAHFLSQCSHESANFTAVSENLNYSMGALIKIFPKYFNYSQAVEYQRKPHDIANRIYANRMGNGNEYSGDGWLFHGRGYIQMTGHDNYKAFGDFIGRDCCQDPDLLISHYPLTSAAWFFTENSVWSVCDRGHDSDTVKAVTRKINGGTNGLVDRQRLFTQYYDAVTK